MGDTTSIQWTATQAPDGSWVQGATFNAWIGCERVSAECDNCYADRGSRRLAAQHSLKLWDEGSSRYFTGEDYWEKPHRWNRKAKSLGVRIKVFCNSYGDVFERRADLVDRRARLMHLIDETDQLDWLLLTKRPENMIELASPVWKGRWPKNVWGGTTVGVRASLSRIDHLRKVPAVVRFLSCEPLLEFLGGRFSSVDLRGIDWVIIGGESGSKARPFNVDWARILMEQCREAGAAPFMKQLGAQPYDSGMKYSLPGRSLTLLDSHGGDMDEWPDDLKIREYPIPRAA